MAASTFASRHRTCHACAAPDCRLVVASALAALAILLLMLIAGAAKADDAGAAHLDTVEAARTAWFR